jgi:hypothetical protein
MADQDKEKLSFLQRLNQEQEKLNEQMRSTMDFDSKIRIQEDMIANSKRIQAEQERLIGESKKANGQLTAEEQQDLDNILKEQKKINEQVKQEGFLRKVVRTTLSDYNKALKDGWRYLMDSDKVIKSTILSLGLSGTKAMEMRGSFEDSARFVAHIGGNLEDVQKVMQGFADETGRARALSAEMVQDIALIGKGTGLGIEQGTKLGAQFELMGVNAKSAMDYVQNVVDTSERMGVNTTKVLKTVSDNFKKLQTMNFQQGVKGYAQMAQYSEKMKIDMNSTFAAMDKVKTLEGAIDTFAQLQVMGGEFAKQDFLEMFYLKRNDPKRFQERINQMTKGVVTFRKMADGSFQKFISPADRDRLEAVEKTLGMQTGELTTQALRMAEMQRLRGKMAGMGLSPKEKELIEGAATFNTETGQFEAKIGGVMKDVTTLTKEQAQAFAKNTVSLKKRAEDAMTVEDALKATIMELKSTLLPLLRSINDMLAWARKTVGPIINALTSGPGAWMKVVGAFMGAALLWRTVSTLLGAVTGNLTRGLLGSKLGTFLSGKGGKDVLAKTAESGSGLFEQRKGIGAGALAKGQGMKALGTGAGAGIAMAGAGAGIMLAAEGLSKLADSMSKLTPQQAKSLATIATTMAITFPLSAIGIALVAGAAEAGALGLLALGAAFVGIGFGVNLAAKGIGVMAEGLTKLVTASKGSGTAMMDIGKGIGVIAASMIGMTLGGGLGILKFNMLMNSIERHSGPKMTAMGDAFAKIGAVLTGSKEDFIAVDNAIKSISNMNTKGGSAFAELATLLKTPLKVEFANKEVAVVSNITMNIDGYKFHQATKTSDYVTQSTVDTKAGKAGKT